MAKVEQYVEEKHSSNRKSHVYSMEEEWEEFEEEEFEEWEEE